MTDVIVMVYSDVIAYVLFMADVIAIYYWQMLLPIYVEDVKPHAFNFCNKCDGWCYCLVADGMATAG